jgi:gliding motility-associated-like protein
LGANKTQASYNLIATMNLKNVFIFFFKFKRVAACMFVLLLFFKPARESWAKAKPIYGAKQTDQKKNSNSKATDKFLKQSNNPPTAVNDTIYAIEDVAAIANVLSNDFDSDTTDILSLNLNPILLLTNGTVQMQSNGSVIYMPNANFNGADIFRYEVCDNGTPILCDTGLVVLFVAAVNDAPVAVADSIQMAQGVAYSGNLISNDTDIDSPTLLANTSTLNGPNNGTMFLANSGVFTYTPNPGFSGTDSFQYIICDNGNPNQCDTGFVFVNVGANNAPFANNDIFSLLEDQLLTSTALLANDFDPDGAVLLLSSNPIAGPYRGTLQLNITGSFEYRPQLNYFGVDSFAYKVCDGGIPNLCDTGWVFLNIDAVNDPPIAQDDSYSVNLNTEFTSTVLTNDSDIEGNRLVLNSQAIQLPAFGSLLLVSNGTFIYTPKTNFSGNDFFTYQVCDNGIPTKCDTALVLLSVLDSAKSLRIPNAFSPNGDNINDFFEISGVEYYPQNEFIVYDRMGLRVYQEKGYLNTWNGNDKNGKMLSKGSYFFVFKKGNNEDEQAGYIVLDR